MRVSAIGIAKAQPTLTTLVTYNTGPVGAPVGAAKGLKTNGNLARAGQRKTLCRGKGKVAFATLGHQS